MAAARKVFQTVRNFGAICLLVFEFGSVDDAKNESNTKKHGVDFETAQLVFEDPLCVCFVDRVIDDEERWHAIGWIEDIQVFVVVHTHREDGADEVIRIISARRASAHERRLYAQAIE